MNEDYAAQEQLQGELDRGETIVWQEKSRPASFSAKAILPFAFVIVWLLIVFSTLFTTTLHRGRNAGGLPFAIFFPVLFGLVIAAAPLARFLIRTQTYYLITNRRALIVTLGRTKKVQSFYAGKLQSLERRERADGRGDVVIDKSAGTNVGGASFGNRYLQEVGFMNVADVKNVEAMLRNLATPDPSGASPSRLR